VDPTDRFARLVRGPRAALDANLDTAALLIAAHARRSLDVDVYRRRLDDLAGACAEPVLAEVTNLLFGAEAFRGNDADYYDPRNSYLDEVLDRRVGIPITLSIVLLEVARRVGVELEGVSMPGHFLVRLAGEPPILLDPFEGGRLLSEGECVERFRAAQGPSAPFDPGYLEPVGTVAILARVLNNLRNIHLQRQDSVSLEWVLRLRGLLPGATLAERTERAGVLAALARFDEAATLLEDLAAEASESQADTMTSKARRLRARLN
jgi:regulator of sirC expression with transglutaminase-like and TPR domain